MILLFSFCGSAQADKSGQLTSLVKGNHKIEYPNSWTVDTSGLVGSELFVLSPLKNDSDKFRENVSVIIQTLAGQNIDLDKYREISEKQLAGLGADIKILESSKVKAVKGDFYSIRYAMNRNNFKLIVTSNCYIRDEKAYLITFTSESSTYEQYKNVGERILGSFQFIK
jgi:hypothetical protein